MAGFVACCGVVDSPPPRQGDHGPGVPLLALGPLAAVVIPVQRAKEKPEAMRAFDDPPEVVIVTMSESPRYVRGLAEVGASAYVPKSSSAEHLVATVRAAALDPEGATRWSAYRARC